MNIYKYIDRCVKDGDCLLWPGALATDGYPRISYKGNCNVKLHRFVHKYANGEDIDGVIVRHTCDTPRCINPDHLKSGTVYDNVLDRDVRLRNGTAKTNPDEVRKIRALYSTGEYTQTELGTLFNLDSRSISYIVLRHTWKWVT